MKSILWQNTRKPFLPFLHKSQKLFTGLDSTRPGKDTDLIFPKNSPSNEPAFLMNTNNHLCLTSVFVVSCTLLSSCSTTGDPTQGGIFWSPDKAMERRQSLLSEQSVKQATYNKIKKTTSSYANTRDDLLKNVTSCKPARKPLPHCRIRNRSTRQSKILRLNWEICSQLPHCVCLLRDNGT